MAGTQQRKFAVLYTNKPHVKRRVFKDGYLIVTPKGSATLLDDGGNELSAAQVPTALLDHLGGTEECKWFDGFVCNVEDECGAAAASGAAGTTQQASSGEAIAGPPRRAAVHAKPRPPPGAEPRTDRAARAVASAPASVQRSPVVMPQLPCKRAAQPSGPAPAVWDGARSMTTHSAWRTDEDMLTQLSGGVIRTAAAALGYLPHAPPSLPVFSATAPGLKVPKVQRMSAPGNPPPVLHVRAHEPHQQAGAAPVVGSASSSGYSGGGGALPLQIERAGAPTRQEHQQQRQHQQPHQQQQQQQQQPHHHHHHQQQQQQHPHQRQQQQLSARPPLQQLPTNLSAAHPKHPAKQSALPPPAAGAQPQAADAAARAPAPAPPSQRWKSPALPPEALPPAAPIAAQPAPTSHYHFPAAGDPRPGRHAAVQDAFPSVAAHQAALLAALTEEVNLRLADLAQRFHGLAQRCVPPRLLEAMPVTLASGPRSADAAAAEKELVTACARAGLAYHPGSSLHVRHNMRAYAQGGSKAATAGKRKKQARRQRQRRGRGGVDSDDDDDGDGSGGEEDAGAEARQETTVFLTLGGTVDRRHFRRGDLLVLSNHPFLQRPGASAADRRNMPWTAVVRSLWHGPDRDGKMQVELLGAAPPVGTKPVRVAALKGPDVSTDVDVAQLIRQARVQALPLLPSLIQRAPARRASGAACDPGGGAAGAAAADCDAGDARGASAALAEVVGRFRLNEAQARVAAHVSSWVPLLAHGARAGPHGVPLRAPLRPPPAPSGAQPPVCLVHGPFGTGKSSLLVALLHLLATPPPQSPQQQQPAGGGATDMDADPPKPGRRAGAGASASAAVGAAPGPRVLVAAHTNVAVDRLLMGLVDSGFTDVLRLGSLPRIAKPLLRYSLHCAEDRRDAVAQLTAMLQGATGRDAQLIQAELLQLKAGAERQRRRRLTTAAVVGVTCCSSMLPPLDGLAFDVLVLDECSQMTEPTSLVPLIRSACRFLVAAGDPCQLPPVVCNPARVAPLPGAPGAAAAFGLARPLFLRLEALGYRVHLLDTQYRLHPALSAVPNHSFYNSLLRDGVGAADRAPLLPGLPPLLFCDQQGGRVRVDASSRSSSNEGEAALVAALVARLLRAGVEPAALGVICLFRAQAQLISQRLAAQAAAPQPAGDGGADGGGAGAGAAAEVQVATVDAFQGAERELIVLATTTPSPGEFARDAARLCVALTRARRHLVVVGAGGGLASASPVLRDVLGAARAGGGYCQAGGVLQLVERLAAAQRLAAAEGEGREARSGEESGAEEGAVAAGEAGDGDSCGGRVPGEDVPSEQQAPREAAGVGGGCGGGGGGDDTSSEGASDEVGRQDAHVDGGCMQLG